MNLTTEFFYNGSGFNGVPYLNGVNCITNDRLRDVDCDTQHCQRSTFTPVAAFIKSQIFHLDGYVPSSLLIHVCNTS